MLGDGDGAGEWWKNEDRELGKSEGIESAESEDMVRPEEEDDEGGTGSGTPRHRGCARGGVGSPEGPPAPGECADADEGEEAEVERSMS